MIHGLPNKWPCVLGGLATLLAGFTTAAIGGVSGQVFVDYNGNGAKEGGEPAVASVQASLYGQSGLVGVAITDVSGTYSISPSAAGPYRLEFASVPDYYSCGLGGAAGNTMVRFLPDGNSIANLPLIDPGNFASEADPFVAASVFVTGPAFGANATRGALLKVPSLASGHDFIESNPNPAFQAVILSTWQSIGSVYGLAWQGRRQKLYAGAYHKRYCGFGPGGPDAIYVLNANGTLAGTLDLDTLLGSSGVAGADVHDFTGLTVYDIGGANLSYDGVGKRSLGDLEISADQKTLYLVNLYARKIYALDISSGIPGQASLLAQWTCPDPTGQNRHRPFGLAWHQNRLWLGTTSEDATNAWVHSLDTNLVTNPGRTFRFEIQVPLSYQRQAFGGNNPDASALRSTWRPWSSDPAMLNYLIINAQNDPEIAYPQAMLADIAFRGTDMILGFRDRFADQSGYASYFRGADTILTHGTSAGDILRICHTALGWLAEGQGACPTSGGLINSGPGGLTYPEHFNWDLWNGPTTTWDSGATGGAFHWETSQGALLQVPGQPSLITTAMNPVSDLSGGLLRFDPATGRREGLNTDGAMAAAAATAAGGYTLHDGGTYSGSFPLAAGGFNQANGLGDLAAMTSAPAIESAHRVWMDFNRNGVQDPQESAVGGVTLDLYRADGTLADTGTTLDSPTSPEIHGTCVFSNLSPETPYYLAVKSDEFAGGELANLIPTSLGAGAAEADNDAAPFASLTGGLAALNGRIGASFTTGTVGRSSHALDFGFRSWDLTGFVFDDLDNDGVKDPGEPGLADVAVRAYDTAGVIVDTAMTRSDGSYTLQTGGAQVRVEFERPLSLSAYRSSVYGPDNSTSVQFRSGSGISEINAGMFLPQPTSSMEIGNRVWRDLNFNGLQDPGEPPIANVTLQLLSADGSILLATVETNALGEYYLSNAPGTSTDGDSDLIPERLAGLTDLNGTTNYLLVVPAENFEYGGPLFGLLPTELHDAPASTGGSPFSDSDVFAFVLNPPSGPSVTGITLFALGEAGGEHSIDLGFREADIFGLAWDDVDCDGAIDVGETGLSGLVVSATDEDGVVIASTVTAENGTYQLQTGGVPVRLDFQLPPTGPLASYQPSASGPNNGGAVQFLVGAGNRADVGFTDATSSSTVEIGDRVWKDTNKNGLQDAGENGIANVKIALLNSVGSLLAVAETDSQGKYLFSSRSISDVDTDGDGLPNGQHGVAALVPGETFKLGVHLTNFTVGALYGCIPTEVYDSNPSPGGNASNDSDGDTVIYSVGTPEESTFGAEITIPANASCNYGTIDFGVMAPQTANQVAIGDRVFMDLNGDGTYQPASGETGLPNVVVELYRNGVDPLDTPFATTVTDSAGCFSFDALAPASYFLRLPPLTFQSSGPLYGLKGSPVYGTSSSADDDFDQNGIPASNPVSSGIQSAAFSFDPGAAPQGEIGCYSGILPDANVNLTIDFGLVPLMRLGGTVWNDANDNGHLDLGESGAAEWAVRLMQIGLDGSIGGGDDEEIATTATVADGSYLFENILPGIYFVEVTPSGLLVRSSTVTDENDNDEDGDDNGAQPGGDDTPVVSPLVLLSGSQEPTGDGDDANGNRTIDFGFFEPATLVGVGNLVFLDANANGHTDAGERVAGIRVEIYPAGGTVGSPLDFRTTDSSGRFFFSNLAPGDYFLHVPASQFLSGNLLNKLSLPGTGTGDDNLGEDGIDAAAPAVTGVSTAVFTLQPNTEPTNPTGESGSGAGLDDADDNNNDLTIDFGFIDPAKLVGVGNLVFRDTNFNDHFDAGEGVANVVVRLFPSTANPLTATPLATTTTNLQGVYGFSSLLPGSYLVHLTPANFQSGGALYGLNSLVGAALGDDHVTEDGVDNANPEANGISSGTVSLAASSEPTDANSEVGFNASADNALDANSDLTIDFGFSFPRQSFSYWKTQNELGGSNEAADNPDGDGLNNALEFALGQPAESGVMNVPPLWITVDDTTGRIDVYYRRLESLSGVTFTLESAASLASGLWTDLTTISPITTINGDGTATVTYQDVASASGLGSGSGFLRLRISVDTDLTPGADITARTQAVGWNSYTSHSQCETIGYPFLRSDWFNGDATSNTADSVVLSGTGSVTSLLSTSRPCYLEVLSGTAAGHRYEIIVAASSGNTLGLATVHERNTKSPVAGELAGAQVAVRDHQLLNMILPAGKFVTSFNPSTADKLLQWKNGGWVSFSAVDLSSAGLGKRWVGSGPAALDNHVLAPCQGLYLCHGGANVSLTFYGSVRQNAVHCALVPGYNLVAAAFPLDQSPAARGMTPANGFIGSTNPAAANGILRWKGDATSGLEGYDSYWLLDAGIPAYQHWADRTDNSVQSQNNTNLFPASRAAFIQCQAGNIGWMIPAGWTP